MTGSSDTELIIPDWPAPTRVRAISTTRAGGCSVEPYDSLNLARHVGDRDEHVTANRARLSELVGYPGEPAWLEQVHGNRIVEAGSCQTPPAADACVTAETGRVCVVMTADCLPVLFCDRQGTHVAAVHAGWRGLAEGILEATVARLCESAACLKRELLAWMGPAIGPRVFEVGEEVRSTFLLENDVEDAFLLTRPGHWNMDIYAVARQRLADVGVNNIYGGNFCTATESQRFFSYRRDGSCGRMASMIWLQDH